MAIHGAVFVDQVITQRLTELTWVGPGPCPDVQLPRVARLFYALSHGIKTLKDFYGDHSTHKLSLPRSKLPLSIDNVARLFPYRQSYPGDHGEVSFKYICKLKEDTSSGNQSGCVFRAKRLHDDQAIVVKFVTRYNATAHRLLADLELAPKLYYAETEALSTDCQTGGLSYLVPQLKMIVMEFLPYPNASRAFLPEEPDGQPPPVPYNFFDSLKCAVAELHRKGLVFGDLRAPNILVGPLMKARLIDFDWCGEDGKDRYPAGLNDNNITWHPDVARYAIMRKEHDNFLFDKLKDRFSFHIRPKNDSGSESES